MPGADQRPRRPDLSEPPEEELPEPPDALDEADDRFDDGLPAGGQGLPTLPPQLPGLALLGPQRARDASAGRRGGTGPRGRSNACSSSSSDHVLEHLEATSLAAVNAAFAQWIEAYNLGRASRALNGRLRRLAMFPRPAGPPPDELELLLVHEEPRKVARTETTSYYGRASQVPDAYIGRRVWTRFKGDRLTIQGGRMTLAPYPLDDEPRT